MATARWRDRLEQLAEAWWLDVPLVAGLTALAAWRTTTGSGLDVLGALPLERRLDAMSNLITISTFLAGFTTVAFTVYLGWNSAGVRAVRAIVGQRLLRLWVAQIAAQWLAALVIWLALVLDRGTRLVDPQNDARWLAVGAALLVVVTVARSAYVFLHLASVETTEVQPTRPVSAKPLVVRSTPPVKQR